MASANKQQDDCELVKDLQFLVKLLCIENINEILRCFYLVISINVLQVTVRKCIT